MKSKLILQSNEYENMGFFFKWYCNKYTLTLRITRSEKDDVFIFVEVPIESSSGEGWDNEEFY